MGVVEVQKGIEGLNGVEEVKGLVGSSFKDYKWLA